ncbi:hypothetical protein [Candidatus Cyanaurora vandensis]|uniref:hypothetical protein n=1 Tax=Candidatus Cyanaurora vandensis TaxID=2714958 RepID=UPI00257E1D77|nr:hypothetical protein [Candidatus Cyanaurora vandensis]
MSSEEQFQALREALHDLNREQAQLVFQQLLEAARAEGPQGTQLSQLLWDELWRTQRSLQFWRSLGEAEGELSKALSDQHIRLQQNYLRLMQEQ